jgi:hypothetical protein
MKPIGDTGFDAKTTAANAAWRTRALQKPKAAAGLHGKSEDGPHQPPHHHAKNQTILPPQSGTQTRVPFRHAPRLTAAFTAQLLGQILPDPERRSCGLTSARLYGGERFTLLPGFDAKY